MKKLDLLKLQNPGIQELTPTDLIELRGGQYVWTLKQVLRYIFEPEIHGYIYKLVEEWVQEWVADPPASTPAPSDPYAPIRPYSCPSDNA